MIKLNWSTFVVKYPLQYPFCIFSSFKEEYIDRQHVFLYFLTQIAYANL